MQVPDLLLSNSALEMGAHPTVSDALPLLRNVIYECMVSKMSIAGVLVPHGGASSLAVLLEYLFPLHCLIRGDASMQVNKGQPTEMINVETVAAR